MGRSVQAGSQFWAQSIGPSSVLVQVSGGSSCSLVILGMVFSLCHITVTVDVTSVGKLLSTRCTCRASEIFRSQSNPNVTHSSYISRTTCIAAFYWSFGSWWHRIGNVAHGLHRDSSLRYLFTMLLQEQSPFVTSSPSLLNPSFVQDPISRHCLGQYIVQRACIYV